MKKYFRLLEVAIVACLICACEIQPPPVEPPPPPPPVDPPPPDDPPGPIQFPKIIFLGVVEEVVELGDEVTLTWSVHNGTNVVLNPGNIPVEASGSMDFKMEKSTTFVLTGEVDGQKVQTSARVVVFTDEPVQP